MSGGDLHVRVGASYGNAGLREVHDANSKPSGNMTEKVTVPTTNGLGIQNGTRDVYMTPEGAAHIRQLQQDSTFGFTAHSDTTSGGFLWLFTVSNMPKVAEQNVGKP